MCPLCSEHWKSSSNIEQGNLIYFKGRGQLAGVDRDILSYLSQARSTRKQGGSILYERSDAHRCFAIYFFNPCLRVLVAWDKYS